MRRHPADSTNRSLAAFEKLQHIPFARLTAVGGGLPPVSYSGYKSRASRLSCIVPDHPGSKVLIGGSRCRRVEPAASSHCGSSSSCIRRA